MDIEIDIFSDSKKLSSRYPLKNSTKNRGAEPKVKLKKLRSVKLSRLPSLKSFRRRSALQNDDNVADILFSDGSNSEQSPRTDLSYAMSDSIESTNSSSPTNDSMETSRSNLKLKKPSILKSPHGSETRRKHTAFRSIKFTDSERLKAGLSKSQDDKEILSANPVSPSTINKNLHQISAYDFDSSSSRNDSRMMHLQSLSTSSTGRKTERKLMRKSSIKPERISVSMKAKKTSFRKTRTPEHPDTSIVRGTCSSILKVSKLANKHKLEGIQNVCEELSTGKVCTYSYCSLHGNRKATEPSLKRFSSMRRRRQKIQKNLIPESSTLPRDNIQVNINQTRGKVRKQDYLIDQAKETTTKNSNVIQNIGSDLTGENRANEKVQFKEIGIQTEDFEFNDNENPAQDSLSQACGSSTKELHILSPVNFDSSMEYSCSERNLDEALIEGIGTDQKDGNTVASSSDKENKPSLPCDEVAPSDHCLTGPENLLSSAKLCLNPNDAAECSREVCMDHKGPFYEGISSTGTDSDNYYFGLSSSPGHTEDLSDVNNAAQKSESLKSEESVEGKPTKPTFGSKSISGPPEEALDGKEEKGIESELRSSQRHSTFEEPEPDSRVDVAHTPLAKQKNNFLWNLIYQNMVSQLPTNEANLQLHGEEDADRHDKKSTTVLRENKDVLLRRHSEVDQSAGLDDEDARLQKVELTQSYAIKLVQEAIDNILLSEARGTTDDHLTTGNIPLQQNLHKVNEGKCLDSNVSTFDIAVKENSADNSGRAEDGKISDIVKNKSTRQLSKSWSNVRKIFLLRRVIKTLERMRHFNPQTSRHLPMDCSPGSEIIDLRHQTEQRRNSEEWMLDYALQLVISKLAPAEKRKVELLIKAYETVVGQPTEIEHSLDPRAVTSSHADFVQPCNDLTVRASEETIETIKREICTSTSLQKDVSSNEVTDTGRTRELGIGETMSGTRFHKDGVIRGTSGKEIPMQEKLILEVPKATALSSNYNLEVNSSALDLNNVNSEEAALKHARSITGNSEKITETDMLSSSPVGDLEGKAALFEHIINKADPETNSMQGHPGSKNHAQNTSNIEADTHLEKEKQMKLWFMVYRRILSGLSAKESTERFLNDADKEKQEDTELGSENHEHSQTMEPYQAEAIKLVEEAIDGIVLSDSEEQLSDNQLDPSYKASDQEIHDDKQSEEDFSISASAGDNVNITSSNVSVTEDTRKNSRMKSPEQEKPLSKLGRQFNKKTLDHWRKVRKLMHFIKALDNVKKINPRKPRYLPSEAEPLAETVNLRHQEVDDWKNSEEWMLDYAIQKAVARLTPVRKRKVHLLVEAFETVIPSIKTDSH